MTECKQFLDHLVDYTDGTLTNTQKAQWDVHLNNCSQCAAVLRRTFKLKGLFRNLPKAKVSTDFNAVLRARIRMERQHRKWLPVLPQSSWGWRIPVWGAAMILLMIVSIVFYNQVWDNKVSQKLIVLQPIDSSQLQMIKQSHPKVDTAQTEPRVNYVLDQVQLRDLLTNSRGVPLSSEGISRLVSSYDDSLRSGQVRTESSIHLVNQLQSRVRF